MNLIELRPRPSSAASVRISSTCFLTAELPSRGGTWLRKLYDQSSTPWLNAMRSYGR
jgi:hypothetical protein